MKRIMFALSAAAMAACLSVSCEKAPQDNEKPAEENIVLSMKADAAFAEDNRAEITLELSKAASEDVTVTLAKAPVQSGKNEVPADYAKNVNITKGQTTAVVTVEADVLGLESGEYQAAVQISDVKGAKKPENAVVYITLNYAFKPEVNIYADNAFSGDRTAHIRVALSKATTKDVTVGIVPSADNKFAVTVEPANLTIAAGQTEAETIATVTIPDDIEIGVHPLSFEISETVNAVVGKVSKATVNLTYPFATSITIDGNFDDWDVPGLATYTLPEGTVCYPFMTEMKLAADEKYAYVYFKFTDPEKVEFFSMGSGQMEHGIKLADNALPIDIYIDTDGNKDTGCYVPSVDNKTFYPPYANDNMGVEWYLEGGFHGGEIFYDLTGLAYYLRYAGPDKENFWTAKNVNHATEITGEAIYSQTAYDAASGVGQTEIQFSRKFFELTGNKARFTVKIMNGDAYWSCIGILPQGTATDKTKPETRVHVDMATLILPNYVE